MCGCVAAKDSKASLSKNVVSISDELDESLPKLPPPPPVPKLTLTDLQYVLRIALGISPVHSEILGRWWHAVGLKEELTQPLALLLQGDGSGMELAVTTEDLQVALSVIPALLRVLPSASAVVASPAAWRQLQDPAVTAPAPLQKQVEQEPQFGAPPPSVIGAASGGDFVTVNAMSSGEALPVEVLSNAAGQMRPRGKAKSKPVLQEGRLVQERDVVLSVSADRMDEHVPSIPVHSRVVPETFGGNRDRRVSFKMPVVSEAAEPERERGPHDSHDSSRRGALKKPVVKDGPLHLSACSTAVHETPGVSGAAPCPPPASSAMSAVATVASPTDAGRLRDIAADAAAAADLVEAIEGAAEMLAVQGVVLWLKIQLGCQELGDSSLADAGISLVVPSDEFADVVPNLAVCEHYSAQACFLEASGFSEASGWKVHQIGGSIFTHGPRALVALEHRGCTTDAQSSVLSDTLLDMTVPRASLHAVRELALHSDCIGLQASSCARTGHRLTLQLELPEPPPGSDRGALAVDLAVGDGKIFDAFMVERFRQLLLGVGGACTVQAIHCRADARASVSMIVSQLEQVT